MMKFSRTRIRMKAAPALAVNARTKILVRFFSPNCLEHCPNGRSFAEFEQAEYDSENFFAEFGARAWPGVVARGSVSSDTDANTEAMVFFGSRESFGYAYENPWRRGRPWYPPRSRSHRANACSKTDAHAKTEIEVFPDWSTQNPDPDPVQTSDLRDAV